MNVTFAAEKLHRHNTLKKEMKVENGTYFSLDAFYAILFKEKQLVVDQEVMDKVRESFEFLSTFSAAKLIYGVNTGFGPMAQYRISESDKEQLQYNLIRSHCSGSGKMLEPVLARAILIARFNCLAQGYSGVHPDLIELIVTLINADIAPCIFEHGGVGASGDLVQLSHLALMLIGEGDLLFEGKQAPVQQVFEKLGIRPLSIHIREGLALINGTSGMTGLGLHNIIQSRRLLYWSMILSAMTNELVQAYDDHFSSELNAVKHHRGQRQVAECLRAMLKNSGMIRKREDHLYDPEKIQQDVFEEKVQEYYSLRCVTQVLGPVLDTIAQAERVLLDEFNSVSDNPIIDAGNENVFHGGNFHGDYVALEMDKVKIAITKLTMLAERQLNYILNDKLNRKFPPFLNLGTLGLNFGMQGIQFTAVSTTAENQTLSFPASVHSIPNNNDNQDIVSMGFNAARITEKVVENGFQVLAIQMMAVLQAVDYLGCADNMAEHTAAVYREMREIVPVIVKDEAQYGRIKRVSEYMASSSKAFHQMSDVLAY